MNLLWNGTDIGDITDYFVSLDEPEIGKIGSKLVLKIDNKLIKKAILLSNLKKINNNIDDKLQIDLSTMNKLNVYQKIIFIMIYTHVYSIPLEHTSYAFDVKNLEMKFSFTMNNDKIIFDFIKSEPLIDPDTQKNISDDEQIKKFYMYDMQYYCDILKDDEDNDCDLNLITLSNVMVREPENINTINCDGNIPISFENFKQRIQEINYANSNQKFLIRDFLMPFYIDSIKNTNGNDDDKLKKYVQHYYNRY